MLASSISQIVVVQLVCIHRGIVDEFFDLLDQLNTVLIGILESMLVAHLALLFGSASDIIKLLLLQSQNYLSLTSGNFPKLHEPFVPVRH